jgi:serine phosphatase RsbU (regulator of sigma subunit)/anti-sigma regulatory factor (Ser/Thr protein kinase)/transposase
MKYGEKFGFNLRQLNGFRLSLDEICTNIVQYAYKGGSKPNQIRIELARKNNRIVTKVVDTGNPFDFESVVDPDLNRYIDEKKKGGFGIYLVRQLNDEVFYERVGKKNVLTLVNRVEPRPSAWERIKRGFKPGKMSIKVRFAIVATLIITVITAGIFYLLSYSQQRTLMRQYINNTLSVLKNFSAGSVDYILKEQDLHLPETIHAMVQENDEMNRLTVVDMQNVVIADRVLQNIGTRYQAPEGLIPLVDQVHLVQEYSDPEFGQSLYFSVPIEFSDSLIGKAFSSIRKDDMMSVIRQRQNMTRIALYVALFWIVGIIGIVFLSNMFVAPIKRIAEEIDRIGREGPGGSFRFSGVGEFAEISTAFNRMMREIRESEARLSDQARLKREMQLAQSIQHTLLPKQVPDTEGFEIAAVYNAAMEVGGDYYDFFDVDEHTVGMAVGDVSGKGIGGAFVMSIVRTALRLEARGEKNAAQVLIKIDSILNGEFKKGMYMTLFYIILDSKRRVINYASAGHTPMILYRGGTGQLFRMNPQGFPIGLNIGDPRLFKKQMRNEKISLSKDDLLLIYTDGITEAMNPAHEVFGEKLLFDLVRQHSELTPREFSNRLMEEVNAFTRGHPQNDDVTFIVIKEKVKYTDLVYEKRMRLFELVDEKGYTVKDACEEVGVSTSTYYKLKRMRDENGFEALKPREQERGIEVLDQELSRIILEVVAEHPEYSAARIGQFLATEEYGSLDIDTTLIFRELKRLKLSNREKRQAYVRRIRRRGYTTSEKS